MLVVPRLTWKGGEASRTARSQNALNEARLSSPSDQAPAARIARAKLEAWRRDFNEVRPHSSLAKRCFFPNLSTIGDNPFQQPHREAAARGRFCSCKIVDQCSPEAAVLTHQAGHCFDLLNFMSERLCLRVEPCINSVVRAPLRRHT
jgi:Integrase core domain